MTQSLEMVYLMNVILYFESTKTLFTFVRVSKKCFDATKSLRVNPWFTTPEHVVKFYQKFQQDTINCCGLLIPPTILVTAKVVTNLNPSSLADTDIPQIAPHTKSIYIPLDNYTGFKKTIFTLFVQSVNKMNSVIMSYDNFKAFVTVFRESSTPLQFFPKRCLVNLLYASQHSSLKDLVKLLDGLETEIGFVYHKSSLPDKKIDFKYPFYSYKMSLIMYQNGIIPLLQHGSFEIVLYEKDTNETLLDLLDKAVPSSLSLNCNGMSLHSFFDGLKLGKYINKLAVVMHNRTLNCQIEFEGLKELNLECSGCTLTQSKSLVILRLDSVKTINVLKGDWSFFKSQNEMVRMWENLNTQLPFINLTTLELHAVKTIRLNIQQKLKLFYMTYCENCIIEFNNECLNEFVFQNNKEMRITLRAMKEQRLYFLKCDRSTLRVLGEKSVKLFFDTCINLSVFGVKMSEIVFLRCRSVDTDFARCGIIEVAESDFGYGTMVCDKAILNTIETYVPIDLDESEEIVLVNLNNFKFVNSMKRCQRLIINNCKGCELSLLNNSVQQLIVKNSDNVHIEGDLDNVVTCKTSRNTNTTIDLDPTKIVELESEDLETFEDLTGSESLCSKNNVKLTKMNDKTLFIRGDYYRELTFTEMEDCVLIFMCQVVSLKMCDCVHLTSNNDFSVASNPLFIRCKKVELLRCDNLNFKMLSNELCEIKMRDCTKCSFVLAQSSRVWSNTPTPYLETSLDNLEVYNCRMCSINLKTKRLVFDNGVDKRIDYIGKCLETMVLVGLTKGNLLLNASISELFLEKCFDITFSVKSARLKSVTANMCKSVTVSVAAENVEFIQSECVDTLIKKIPPVVRRTPVHVYMRRRDVEN
ncbi:hypothetical protein EIN_173250 [Entamoeba invadens IP1]|uniref:Uncharacterized protein n=1 Tax=Entamoeba invadens IP1 TaxID=370355 RepID=A0A0A1TYM4_ENTIV|nr:hypothetical protein EIN_173250 [Entamoeba invadens IP1]ELP84660.1 hypothetical protein EIN_173250 [Entamoeba invadens IP1]|eukprot:XP_004184006.1 hypothetical protein EIN_173250 [Entamoeba invadens IP1]